MNVSNTEDILDSRNVIARFDELTKSSENPDNGIDESEMDELMALQTLIAEAKDAPDWEHGQALIRDTYFESYARELAEDIGAIGHDLPWPANCIDWDRAVYELQMDYMSVDFDGIEYWIRA